MKKKKEKKEGYSVSWEEKQPNHPLFGGYKLISVTLRLKSSAVCFGKVAIQCVLEWARGSTHKMSASQAFIRTNPNPI
jgi:hypothetical protein